jgi:hypothetical protein
MLAILCIERREMEAAGLIKAGNPRSWSDFRRDPYRWLLRLDEDQASALWKLIQAHNVSSPTTKETVGFRHGRSPYRSVATTA